MDPWLAVLFGLHKRNLLSGAPSDAEHGQRLSPRYIAMENITSSFPALIVQVSCEPWHTRRRPIRSWLGGTDLENLLSWLAKRVAGGIIELSRCFQSSSRRNRRLSRQYCGKQKLCRIIKVGHPLHRAPTHCRNQSLGLSLNCVERVSYSEIGHCSVPLAYCFTAGSLHRDARKDINRSF